MSSKKCRKCCWDLPRDSFPPQKQARDGLSSWCKGCHRDAVRRWQKANPEKVRALYAARKVPHPPRACGGCEREFVPKHGNQRYCRRDDCELLEARRLHAVQRASR
jgi:hypothetical protein